MAEPNTRKGVTLNLPPSLPEDEEAKDSTVPSGLGQVRRTISRTQSMSVIRQKSANVGMSGFDEQFRLDANVFNGPGDDIALAFKDLNGPTAHTHTHKYGDAVKKMLHPDAGCVKAAFGKVFYVLAHYFHSEYFVCGCVCVSVCVYVRER
jgi:hypothetical protein